MPKIGRTLSYINTERKGKGTEQLSVPQPLGSSRPGGSVSMSQGDYLLKSIWDKVFEFRTTDSGEEYLFGKLNLALQYGLTTFVDGKQIELPDIYDGLRIDNQTIYWDKVEEEITDEEGNVTTKVTKVLKAKGSGEGTIKDVTVNGDGNALTSVSLSGDKKSLVFTKDKTFAEKTYLDDNFAKKTYVDQNFVTLATSQIITGNKNFTGGLSVNGCELVYNPYYGYWKLTGDLLVTGGIASFSSDTAFSPTSIMDGIVCDGQTIKVENINGVKTLKVIGGTDKGVKVELVTSSDQATEADTLYVIV